MLALADRAPEALETLVNKRELARILDVSLPTLGELIDRYPDFPIEERGSNGVSYKFDPRKVTAFIRAKKEEEARASEQRKELLEQFTLPIDDVAPEGAAGLTPAQRLAAAKAHREERKLALETGLLAEVPKLRQDLTIALARLGRFFDSLPSRLASQFNLPEEVARAMRKALDEQRRVFVAELEKAMVQDDE